MRWLARFASSKWIRRSESKTNAQVSTRQVRCPRPLFRVIYRDRSGGQPSNIMSVSASDLLICRYCDALHRPVFLGSKEVAVCVACGHVLMRQRSFSVDQLLALSLTATVLFFIANACPLMAVQVGGIHTEATLLGSAWLMLGGWTAWPALVLALTMFVVPLLQIALITWVLAFARLERQAPGLRASLTVLHRARPWSMTEVCVLGALVAIVKLSGWVHIVPEVGIWALAGVTTLLAILGMVEPRHWWNLCLPRT
jgi:paraquat-inducible protein A